MTTACEIVTIKFKSHKQSQVSTLNSNLQWSQWHDNIWKGKESAAIKRAI